MNRIYKVVWSKAKNCCVVVSELAKRKTKGGGTRFLGRAAVTLGIVAGLTVGMTGSVWAESHNVTYDSAKYQLIADNNPIFKMINTYSSKFIIAFKRQSYYFFFTSRDFIQNFFFININ